MTSIRILDLTDRTEDDESPMFVHLLAELNGAVHGQIGVGVLADGHWALHLPDASISVEPATLTRLISSAVHFVKTNHRIAAGPKSDSAWLQCLLMPDDPRASCLEAAGLEELSDLLGFESTLGALCSSLTGLQRSGRAGLEIRTLNPIDCARGETDARLIPLLRDVLSATDGVQRLPPTSPQACLDGWRHRTSTSVCIAESRGRAGVPDGILVVDEESSTDGDGGREIVFIGVRSERRRRGVASALIADALCGSADTHSKACVHVTCAEKNATALTFYRRLGFSVIHRLRLFGLKIPLE